MKKITDVLTWLEGSSTWPLYFDRCSQNCADTDVNATDGGGLTLLHYFAESGEAGCAQDWISRGASVDAADGAGNTPLFFACCYGHADIVSLLLKNGANPCAKNREGLTALDYAMHLDESNKNREVIIGLFRDYSPELCLSAYCTEVS